ncbi:unnamed protein product [Pylaiella littoralis]
MKFSTVASLGLFASFGTSRCAECATFDNLLALVAQLETEADMLAKDCRQKEDDIASLTSQLSTCERGSGGDDWSSSTSDDKLVTSASDDDSSTDSGKYAITGDGSADDGVSDDKGVTSASDDDGSTRSSADGITDDDGSTDSSSGKKASSSSSSSSSSSESAGTLFSGRPSWNYNLASPVDTTVDVDVFFIDMDNEDVIVDLHDKGKVVVCYISVGTVEAWRDDVEEFPAEAVGGPVENWAGEEWLDVNNAKVREIMIARVEKAAKMSCDAIEPDNMMVAYEDNTGVSVTKDEQKAYNVWFASEVHKAGMAVGLKNAGDMAADVEQSFDFVLNESCHQYNECDDFSAFLAADKAVFNVEYVDDLDVCEEANALGFDTIIKDYDLKAPFCSCVDRSRDLNCMDVL